MLLKPQFLAQAGSTPPPPAKQVDRNVTAVGGPVRERSYSNEIVTVEDALGVDGVIAIITLVSQDLAGMPLILYGREAESRRRATEHSYYSLMHDAPNPEMTSYTFRELVNAHLVAWGNFYGQMIWDETGVVREIWPLRPDRMIVQRIDGQRVYLYRTSDGRPRTFLSDEILHVPGFGFDGLVGYSRISLARNAIGLSMAAERFGGKFFANDTALGVAFKTPNTLGDEAYKRLKESIDDQYRGAEKAHQHIILEEGLDVARLGLPPEDIQFLETRRFNLAAINRMLGPLPPHMIGDVERSTSWGSGIDSQEQGYVNHALRPYAIRIEQTLNQKLLLNQDRQAGLYFEHLFDALLRGDIQTRFEAYVKGITNGIYSPNQALAKENINGYPGGDFHYVPANLICVETGLPVGAQAAGPQADPVAQSRPLFLDAAQRVLRRESMELRDAGQRWTAKGKEEKFIAWAGQFYARELPEFAVSVFQPLVDAGMIPARQVQAGIDIFCQERVTNLRAGCDLLEYQPDLFLQRMETQ